MSRAHDYLKATIAELGPEREAEFWTEYNRLARMDARDSEAKQKRRRLSLALTKLNGLDVSDSQYKRWTEARDRARAWLAKYGYSEETRS